MPEIELFKAWVNERSPKPSAAYLKAAISLVSNPEIIKDSASIENWLNHNSLPLPRARHALKLVLQWAASINLPSTTMPPIKARPLFSMHQLELLEKRSTQTINRRQHFVMALLYSYTDIPPGRMPMLLVSHVRLTVPYRVLLDGTSYPIKEEALAPLKSWIALRSKLARYEKERRFYCKTEAWAKSHYLFPNHRGFPSDRSSIRKLLQSASF